MLAQALTEEDLGVRNCAAKGLELNPNSKAIPKLIELSNHEDSLLRRLVGNALIASGEQASKQITEEFAQLAPGGQIECARTLAKIGDPASISLLFSLLDSESHMLRHWAGEGLDAMGLVMRFFSPQ